MKMHDGSHAHKRHKRHKQREGMRAGASTCASIAQEPLKTPLNDTGLSMTWHISCAEGCPLQRFDERLQSRQRTCTCNLVRPDDNRSMPSWMRTTYPRARTIVSGLPTRAPRGKRVTLVATLSHKTRCCRCPATRILGSAAAGLLVLGMPSKKRHVEEMRERGVGSAVLFSYADTKFIRDYQQLDHSRHIYMAVLPESTLPPQKWHSTERRNIGGIVAHQRPTNEDNSTEAMALS